jgi:hypothetical protein
MATFPAKPAYRRQGEGERVGSLDKTREKSHLRLVEGVKSHG